MRLSEVMAQTSVTKENVKSYRLSDVMALDSGNIKKNERDFFQNMKKSFSRGRAAADIDQAGYLAKNKQMDFDKDVRPLVEAQRQAISSDPIKGENFVSNTMYMLANMAPAMLNGIIEGKGAAAVSGLATAAVFPPAALPMAVAGDLAGAFNYWRRQGTGAIYIDMKMQDEPIDDAIANPISDVGGIMYGAIEFSQIRKLMPGSDKVIKGLVSDTLKKTFGRMFARYGINWVTEVGEEGLQEVITETAKDVGNRVAGQSNKTVGQSVEKILNAGWTASKDSALPMLFLMAPGTAIDAVRIADMGKQVEAHKEQTEKSAVEINKIVESLKVSGKAVELAPEKPVEAITPTEKVTVKPKPLEQRIADVRTRLKQPQAITKAEIKEYQKEITSFIKELDIEAKDKAKFLSVIKEANTEIQLEKAAKKVYERAVKFAEATTKRETKVKIEKELKYTKPVAAKGKYEYEDNKTFQEFRDINKLTQKSAQETLDKIPEEGLDEMGIIRKRLLAYKANGMSGSAELHKQVLADIKQLKFFGKLAKNEKEFLEKINRSEIAKEVSDAIDNIVADKNTFITKFGNLYRKGFTSHYSMLNSIAGLNMAKKHDLEKHENNKVVAIHKKTRELTDGIKDILDLSHRDMVLQEFQNRAEEKYQVLDTQGLETEIDKMDIIDIYNSVKNPLIKERYNNYLGAEQVNRLLSQMTPNEILIADLLQETLQEYHPVLNQRSIETTGLDLGPVENYWPATSEHAPDLLDDYKVQGETPSAMKARSESSKIFPIPRNAWTKTMRHVSQAEHVAHLSREFVAAKRLFSNRKVKNQIVNKFGEDVYNTLMDQIENQSLNKITARGDAVSNAFGKMVNNWVTAKIALNPNVFAKQLLSPVNYSENMPVGQWSAGFFKGLTTPKATFDFMWNNSEGFLEQRFNRGYSEAIQDALEGASQISKNKYSWTKGLSSFVRAGDILAIVYGGYPVVQAELAKGKSMKEAFATFKDATLKSQQSGLTSSISQWQNNRTSTARLFLAFKNTSNQYFRKQVDAIISYNNKDISIGQLAKVTTIYSIINPIIFAGSGIAMAMGMRALGTSLFGAVHDDEKDAESIMLDLFIQVVINPFMAVPLLDDMANFAARTAVGKSTWKVFSTPVIDDIETAMRAAGKDYVSLEDYFSIFGTVVEIKTGAPAKSFLRNYKLLAGE